MAKKANPTAVGSFVLGALVLFVAGTYVLGRGRLFQDDLRFVCNFESSVAGLDIGAPVRFNGVKVGEVSNIQAVWLMGEEGILTPVTLSFGRDSIKPPPGTSAADFAERDPYDVMDRLIETGLRAELLPDSFVTGKLYVAMQSYPDSPVNLKGGTTLPEIPTREAGLVAFAKSIGDLPIQELIEDLLATVRSFRAMADDIEVRETIASVRRLVERVDGQVEPVTLSLRESLQAVEAAAARAAELLETTDSKLDLTIDDVRADVLPLASSMEETLKSMRTTLGRIDESIGDDSEVVYRIVVLLEDLAEAARSITGVARTLERNPEALIKGKPQR